MWINIWTQEREAPKKRSLSFVGQCTPAQHLQLQTIPSMSQRLRSLKITHWDCFRSQTVFFSPSVFGIILVSEKFPWRTDDSFYVRVFVMASPIQTSCKKATKASTQCLFVVSMQKAHVFCAVAAHNVILLHNVIFCQ